MDTREGADCATLDSSLPASAAVAGPGESKDFPAPLFSTDKPRPAGRPSKADAEIRDAIREAIQFAGERATDARGLVAFLSGYLERHYPHSAAELSAFLELTR